MKVTNEMIEAAMKKATEAGLLPRHACKEEVSINRELIRIVVQAALDVPYVPQATSRPHLQIVRAEPDADPMNAPRRIGPMSRVSGRSGYVA